MMIERYFILILSWITLSGCGSSGDASKTSIGAYGDFGLQSVFCESGQLFVFEAEAVSLTSTGTYQYRQIFLHPPSDPAAIQCYFSSTGQIRVGEGMMQTKYDARTLTYAARDQVHFRGEINGEKCTFEYIAKPITLEDVQQSVGCP